MRALIHLTLLISRKKSRYCSALFLFEVPYEACCYNLVFWFLKEPAPKKAVASTNGTVAKDDSSSEEESSDEVNFLLLSKFSLISLDIC